MRNPEKKAQVVSWQSTAAELRQAIVDGKDTTAFYERESQRLLRQLSALDEEAKKAAAAQPQPSPR